VGVLAALSVMLKCLCFWPEWAAACACQHPTQICPELTPPRRFANPLAQSFRRNQTMSDATDTEDSAQWGNISADRLRSIIERIERLEEERKGLASDIKDIYAEAKSAGFDVKVIRELIKIRKQEPADVEELETLLTVYRHALGM
jgi:uncharacterized protein (UPF0335 family)